MQLELIETKVMMTHLRFYSPSHLILTFCFFAIGKRVYRFNSDDEQCKLLSVNLLFLPGVAITEF